MLFRGIIAIISSTIDIILNELVINVILFDVKNHRWRSLVPNLSTHWALEISRIFVKH